MTLGTGSTSSTLNFVKPDNSLYGSIVGNTTGLNLTSTSNLNIAGTGASSTVQINNFKTLNITGVDATSSVQISNITSLNAPGLATLTTSQVGTPLVLDSNNNIVKNNSFYALYITHESGTNVIKLYRQTFGEFTTYSGPGTTYGKAYYLFNHLTPRPSSTFTPNWVGNSSSTFNTTVSYPYLKFPCLGYWFISFNTYTYANQTTPHFQVVYIYKNVLMGGSLIDTNGNNFTDSYRLLDDPLNWPIEFSRYGNYVMSSCAANGSWTNLTLSTVVKINDINDFISIGIAISNHTVDVVIQKPSTLVIMKVGDL